MINADYRSKERIVSILAEAFENNKSVNHVVKNDHKRHKRIRILMEYAFDTAFSTGAVFLSEDRNGCALLLFPDKKNSSLKDLLWNIKIAFTCMGLSNIKPTLQRNALIKRSHPSSPIAHLWFLGVADHAQHTGIGTVLLNDIIHYCRSKNRPVYLETSTVKNIPWYQSFGFELFNKIELDYTLYLFKKEYL